MNNPVNNKDYSGTISIPAVGAAIGGAIGGSAISTMSYIVATALSGQSITVAGLANAAVTGAVSGAVGGLIGTINLATKAATVVAKGIASTAVGVVLGVKTGLETSGSTLKRVLTGITTGAIAAGSTFLGSRIDAYEVTYGLSGNAFTNFSATLFVGTPAEIASVATQQSIGMIGNNASGIKPSPYPRVSTAVNRGTIALPY